MRLPPAVFWNYSLKEWVLAQRGFFELRNDEYKRTWEQARFMAYYGAFGFLPKRTQMTDLIRFEWDVKYNEVSEEDADYWLRKLGKFTDENGKGYNA